MQIKKYRLPAEWEHYKSILIMFPHNNKDFPSKFQPVKWAFVEYIKKLSQTENVIVIVNNKKHKQIVEQLLKDSAANIANIQLVEYAVERAWMRDSGPITVLDHNQQPTILDFKFNAWARYKYNLNDDQIPQFIAKLQNLPCVQPMYNGKRIVLEGGAIDINGKGTLICTEECLMSTKQQIRNQGFTKQDYENIFNQYFGITNVIWLGKGIEGDDTHGHVDDFCRFVNEDTVVLSYETNQLDINYQALNDNLNRLKNAKLQNGKALNIITLPMPSPVVYKNMRLPASYANFLITNNLVVVPTYNDVNDRIALNILSEVFPKRNVIGINAVDIVWGLGSLHCLSHELR